MRNFSNSQNLYQHLAKDDPKLFEVLNKLTDQIQYLYSSIDILNAENLLTHAGVIPEVNKDGGLSESTIKDDGINVTFRGRHIRLNGFPRTEARVSVTGGTQPGRLAKLSGDDVFGISQNLSYDGVNFSLDDTSKPGLYLRISNLGGGRLDYFTAPAGPNPPAVFVSFTIDNAGNLNIPGIYNIAGVPGQSNTITYVTGLSGTIPAGLTVTTKTVTFTGGIETGHT
jgi:hypothetical protein